MFPGRVNLQLNLLCFKCIQSRIHLNKPNEVSLFVQNEGYFVKISRSRLVSL